MKRILFPFLLGVLVLGAWYATRYQIDVTQPSRKFMLPYPHEVILAAYSEREPLLSATWSTTKGALAGFSAAIVFSIGCALLLASAGWIRAALFPYLMILQMTPIIVITPILLIWIGPGLLSVALITFLISFFPLVVNTTQGLLSTEKNLVELFRLCRASRLQEMLLLRLPSALPYFFTGLRISAILAPIGAVVGDFFAGNSGGGVGGLGFRTVIYSSNLDTAALFATAALCCLLGFALAAVVNLISRLVLQSWHASYL